MKVWCSKRLCPLLLLTIFFFSANATVNVSVIGALAWKVFVSDVSEMDDAKKFDNIQKAVGLSHAKNGKDVTVAVDLNSQGGDIYAAMRIGRVIRKIGASVIIKNGNLCASSCVLILAGAGQRFIDKEALIAIHRPYQMTSSKTTAEREKAKYERLGSDIKTYLQEMNIDVNLYRDMLLISPHKERYLTFPEIEAYGFVKEDPFIEEAAAMNKAAKLGISRQELAVREGEIDRLCKWSDDDGAISVYFKCMQKILKTGRL